MSGFRALVLDQVDDRVEASIKELNGTSLPEGDVTVAVEYSTLNYKDGMVLNGLGNLVRNYPHVPGIDFSGTVEASDNPNWKAGDPVVLTGYHVGERHWGGYAQKARVKGDWLVRRPDGLTAERAMAIGTAGFTAMLCIMALEDHGVSPDKGDVLVTGAAGGGGSIAVSTLANLGFRVVASSGRPEQADYLKGLGAAEIIHRSELAEGSGKPLEKERWAGCVDSVGSTTLATVLAQMKYGGSVAALGLAGGPKLNTTVIPFLLRGVNLLGIDSVMCPMDRRQRAWQRLEKDLPADKLDATINRITLDELPAMGSKILEGKVRGRTVVDVNAA